MGFWDSLSKGFTRGISGQPAETPQPVTAVHEDPPAVHRDEPIEVAPGISIAAGIDVMVNGSIEKLHAETGPIADAPPPTPGREYRIVDVPGSWTRAVAGDSHFADYIERMPLGPVLVTLRFEPNDTNKYGVSAYVNGRQVGWLSTEWTASDPPVKFLRRLDDAGILPRFKGIHRLTGNTGSHIINFDVPGRDDGRLGDIARRITGQTGN